MPIEGWGIFWGTGFEGVKPSNGLMTPEGANGRAPVPVLTVGPGPLIPVEGTNDAEEAKEDCAKEEEGTKEEEETDETPGTDDVKLRTSGRVVLVGELGISGVREAKGSVVRVLDGLLRLRLLLLPLFEVMLLPL